jgi:hypothetical protein
MRNDWNMFEAMQDRYSGADGQDDPIAQFREFLTGLPAAELDIALSITRLAEGKETITMAEIEQKLGVPEVLKPAVRERIAPVLKQIRAYMLAMAQQSGGDAGGGGGGGGYVGGYGGGVDMIPSPAAPQSGSGSGSSNPSAQDVLLPQSPVFPESGTISGTGRPLVRRPTTPLSKATSSK